MLLYENRKPDVAWHNEVTAKVRRTQFLNLDGGKN